LCKAATLGGQLIHLFPKLKGAPIESPLGRAVESSGVAHRFFPAHVDLSYRSRFTLLLLGWPKLIGMAVRSAVRSLWVAKPYPEAVLVESHFEVLIFSALRALRRRPGPRIVLLGFIFTPRRSTWLESLRSRYFGFVLRSAEVVIVHSSVEALEYQEKFSGKQTRFVYVQYGLQVIGREIQEATDSGGRPRLLSAGRSGRDYGTLFTAVDGLDIDVHVVCDRKDALAGLKVPSNVKLLRQCYGDEYIRELRACQVVVIPLAVDSISAGQMVLLQAMAFGKPVVISRTRTVEEYLSDTEDAVLVTRADPSALRKAITELLADPDRAAGLGKNAQRAYETKYSLVVFVNNILAAMR
jgi:glycosyltransferase involved in cell wall biosynthesis